MNLRRIIPLAILLAAGGAALAQDDERTRDAKARIEYFDKTAGRVKDDQKYGELVMDLASFPHEMTVDRVARIVLRDPDEERKLIAAAALGEFRAPDTIRDAAGKQLVKALDAGLSNDVTDTCIDAIGRILYKDAVPKLGEIVLGGGDPYVLLTTVRVMGKLNDRRALPFLLILWERHPVGYSWETGEVKVDTGAAGTADQEAAEAAWNAKYGNKIGGKKKPPVMFKVYIQEVVRTVKKLTGDEKLEKPADLRLWMEQHADELRKEGVEIPKYTGPTRKDDKDKKDGKKGKDGKDEKDEKPAK